MPLPRLNPVDTSSNAMLQSRHWLLGFLLFFISSLGLLLWWLATPEPVANVRLSNGAELEWTPCWFHLPLDWRRYPQCAYFYPADANRVAGQQRLKLPVAILRQRAWLRDGEPLLYLAGGPGGAAFLDDVGIFYWQSELEENAWAGDWVLFDQRGAGLSTPKLSCTGVNDRLREMLAQALSPEEDLRQLNAAYADCYAHFSAAGVDLSAFNTERNAQDAVELMQLLQQPLQAQQWNLYGVSYGTRLALQVMRIAPQSLRSVILDSVYPPQRHALAELPFLLDRAQAVLLTGCQATPKCQQAYPNLAQDFAHLLQQVQEQPFDFEVLDPETIIPLRVQITPARWQDVLFVALYHWDFIELLPSVINQAAQGDPSALQPLVSAYVDMLLDANFSDAMNLSVECYDMGEALDEAAYQAQVARYPKVSQFAASFWAYSPCRFWRNQRATAEFLTPVTSAVPTLLLSGYYDPVTPPQWAQETAKTLSHSRVLLFPDMGHGLIDSSECATHAAVAFERNPTAPALPECLQDMEAADFVLPE